MTKICKRCGLEKSIDDFYNNPFSKDGKRYACKNCWHKMTAQANMRMRKRNPEIVIKERKYKSNWRQKHPEAIKAHNILNNGIRNGLVVRGICIFCSNKKPYGHHEDYSKPLDVLWICPKHHTEIHRIDWR